MPPTAVQVSYWYVVKIGTAGSSVRQLLLTASRPHHEVALQPVLCVLNAAHLVRLLAKVWRHTRRLQKQISVSVPDNIVLERGAPVQWVSHGARHSIKCCS